MNYSLSSAEWAAIAHAVGDLFVTTLLAMLLVAVIAFPLGIALFVMERPLQRKSQRYDAAVTHIVQFTTTVPFIVIASFLFAIGSVLVNWALTPLTAALLIALVVAIYSTAVVVRALQAIPQGIKEAAYAMGATHYVTIRTMLLPEAKPALVQGGYRAVMMIVSYVTIIGFIGTSGFGQTLLQYSVHTPNVTVIALLLVLFIIIYSVLQLAVKRLTTATTK